MQLTTKASQMTRKKQSQMEECVIYFNIKSKLKFSANSWLTHVPGAPKDLLVPSTVSCITASRLSSEAPSLRLSAKLCWTLFLHHNNHSNNILYHEMFHHDRNSQWIILEACPRIFNFRMDDIY